MCDRFQRLNDGTIFDNTTLKRHKSLDELIDTINDMHLRLLDYDERRTTFITELSQPGHALQLGKNAA